MTGSLLARYERDGDLATTLDRATRTVLGEITGRALTIGGVQPRDVVQVTQSIDASGAAWPVLCALDQLDAVVVATGGLRATPALRQLEFVRCLGVTALCANDAVVDALAEAAAAEGYDLAGSPLRRILLTTPALSTARRREIESTWHAAVFRVYVSRSAPAWAAVECDPSRAADGCLGLHGWDDGLILDVVEADGSPSAAGQFGNLVETFRVGSSPSVVQMSTGLRARLLTGPCPCGRTTRRVEFDRAEDRP